MRHRPRLRSGNYAFRSCAWAAMGLGKTQRAEDFIRLDAGSEWAPYVTTSLLLREGKVEEAREAAKHIQPLLTIIAIWCKLAFSCGRRLNLTP